MCNYLDPLSGFLRCHIQQSQTGVRTHDDTCKGVPQRIVDFPGKAVAFPHLRHAFHIFRIIPELIIGLVQLFIQLADTLVFCFLTGKQQNHIQNKHQNIHADHQAFQHGKEALGHGIIVAEIGTECDTLGELRHNFITAKGKQQAEHHNETQPHFIAADIMHQVSKH